MNILFILLFIINYLANSIKAPSKYISYSNIRPIYYDMYNINSKMEFNEKYSLEHVIPRSIYKDDSLLKRDMHNIILYPNKINNHRCFNN